MKTLVDKLYSYARCWALSTPAYRPTGDERETFERWVQEYTTDIIAIERERIIKIAFEHYRSLGPEQEEFRKKVLQL